MRRSACMLLLLWLTAPVMAADKWPYQARCRQWADTPIPQQDIGTAPAKCDTTKLYYGDDGKGRGRDYVAARHCAYKERSPDGYAPAEGTVFGGSGVLMMLYANGQGVARNLPLARRFACEYDGAPAEIAGRLDHLDAIATGRDTQPLDICDDITSGMMGGFCAYRDASFARAIRADAWTALQSRWTPTQRTAFAALRRAADAYFESASENEVDLSGTLRGAFTTEAREALEIALLQSIQHFEHGERPAADSLPAADKALNATYKHTRTTLAANDGSYGTITADGVREVQRKWLPYRDAWVAFAAARYPDTPAERWQAWLSGVRTKALAAIINGG